eukprot:1161201-Pelagomonas_calceolata.AAC.7
MMLISYMHTPAGCASTPWALSSQRAGPHLLSDGKWHQTRVALGRIGELHWQRCLPGSTTPVPYQLHQSEVLLFVLHWFANQGRQQATAAGQRFKAEVEKMPKPSGGLIFLTSPFSRTIDTATLAAAEVPPFFYEPAEEQRATTWGNFTQMTLSCVLFLCGR